MPLSGDLFGDGFHGFFVGTFQTSSQSIREHLGGQALGKCDRIGFQERLKVRMILEGSPVRKRPRSLDGELAVFFAPSPDGIEAFKGEP